jgi:ankyrin repeat protein
MGKNSALCQAVVSGTARQVKKLIDEGADINGIEVAESRTPLTAAIDHGKTDIALLLLQLGADPTARPKKNWKPESPLHLAAQRGNLDVVRELIARGVNVNAVITPHNGFAGRTPLMNAADGGQLEVVRFLIEHGADVSARDQRGNTALTAAENKEVRAYLAELLAQRPLDTRPGDLAGAVRDGLTDRVTALLDAGMAADDVDSFGASALMVAVEKGDVTMASLLLDRGANANFLSANGWLPITTFGIKPKMINLLLERGADPNAAMGDDATVLSWAFGSGSKQLVQALLDAGGKLELDEAQKKRAGRIAASCRCCSSISARPRMRWTRFAPGSRSLSASPRRTSFKRRRSTSGRSSAARRRPGSGGKGWSTITTCRSSSTCRATTTNPPAISPTRTRRGDCSPAIARRSCRKATR